MFALWKWFTQGGYVIMRKSHYTVIPHFMWAKDLKGIEVEQYLPVVGARRKVSPPIIFKGYVKVGDDQEKRKESV